MAASRYASLGRTPKPRAVVECGPYSDPNFGCTAERQDAITAYTPAGTNHLFVAWQTLTHARNPN
jgi:hypothetical protein